MCVRIRAMGASSYTHTRALVGFFFFVCVCVRGGPPYSHALVHVWLLTRCLRALQPRCSCASSLSSFAERVRLSLVAPSWRFAHVHMWFVFCLARCSDIMTRRQVYCAALQREPAHSGGRASICRFSGGSSCFVLVKCALMSLLIHQPPAF